jgi:hypothetical protein
VAELRRGTISPVPAGDSRAPVSTEYNCFAYALDLADSERYRMIAKRFGWLYADTKFVMYLVSERHLRRIDLHESVDGDIVVYFDQASLAIHAGKTCGVRIVSKWGSGLLWEHPLWEVPESYGKTMQLYKQTGTAAAESAFLRYVASEGIDLNRWGGWRERFAGASHNTGA